MEKFNRRSALTLGAVAAASAVALSLTTQTAKADERHYRYHKLHEAAVALRVAREEILHAGHDFGGQKVRTLEAIDRAIEHLDRLRDFGA